ncbi:MAG: hypothetical protein HY399_04105 [Elusimicrobia bacterium]|nr:hypothetical protein [Elusimicrobiota bacterium]
MRPNLLISIFLISSLIIGCASPQVAMRRKSDWNHPQKVAIFPFDNLSGRGDVTLGMRASQIFGHQLVNFAQYQLVEVGAMDGKQDPIEVGRRLGVDAVVVGAVTDYRPRKFMIFPPASVGIEVKLLDVATREVQWSVSYRKTFRAVHWISFIVWPIGVFLTVTSPTEETRLQQVCQQSTEALLYGV